MAVVVSLFSRLGRAFVTAALSARSSPLNQCPPPRPPRWIKAVQLCFRLWIFGNCSCAHVTLFLKGFSTKQ